MMVKSRVKKAPETEEPTNILHAIVRGERLAALGADVRPLASEKLLHLSRHDPFVANLMLDLSYMYMAMVNSPKTSQYTEVISHWFQTLQDELRLSCTGLTERVPALGQEGCAARRVVLLEADLALDIDPRDRGNQHGTTGPATQAAFPSQFSRVLQTLILESCSSVECLGMF